MIQKKLFTVILSALLIVILSTAYAADMNPLPTERAETIGKGHLRLNNSSSLDYLNDNTRLYHFSSLNLILGVAENADLFLKYRGLTYREGPDFNDAIGPGDLTVGLKASPFSGDWGTLGFLISTKLPNANDKDGLGTDVQDFHLVGLYTLALKSLILNFNAGLHIIGDTTEMRKYHYLFGYGVGFEYMISDHFSIVGDVSGATGGRDDFEWCKATLGFVAPIANGWEWGLTASAGLTSETPDWSVGLHFSREWSLDGLIPDTSPASGGNPTIVILYPFPLDLEEAATIGHGSLYFEAEFSAMGFKRYNLYTPSLDLRYGIAEGVDVQVEIPYSFLEDSPIYGRTDGLSDVRVGFKISPWRLGKFQFGVLNEIKMPSTNDSEGLGKKEMDYTLLFLTSASLDRFLVHLNLGFSIEGNPEETSSQRDFLIFGAGAEYALTDWLSLYGNFYGKTFHTDRLCSYLLEGGFRFMLYKKIIVSASGGTGFANNDPDWTANFGVALPIDF
ncbi:MAG: hypothetical protein JW984_01385 [Deltaproteobacteria bacterium]|uniref:Uncharacterized protein n=1 Tax=Candidatus Zymogenus saltonus TaxID=2844893 RepID=A0A9D8KCY1_9DELT|nr:hypothetical protein [Candidatus Zymogenus saltonus]